MEIHAPKVPFNFQFKIKMGKSINNLCMKSIIQKIYFLKNKNYFFLHFLKMWKTNFFQIYIKLNFGKIVKSNFMFWFYLPIFLLISYSVRFSMGHCFKRLILHFLINTFHNFYVKFHHSNIKYKSVFFQVFTNMRVTHKQRCLGHRFGHKTKLSRINWEK